MGRADPSLPLPGRVTSTHRFSPDRSGQFGRVRCVPVFAVFLIVDLTFFPQTQ
jgi:hypothetical protein